MRIFQGMRARSGIFCLAMGAVIALGSGLAPAPALADSRGFCPPGLAKKHNGCNPPGHARHDGRDRDRDRDHDRDWSRLSERERDRIRERERERAYYGLRPGDDLRGRDDWRWLSDPRRYSLPSLRDGQRYAVIGNQIVTVDRDTLRILSLLQALN